MLTDGIGVRVDDLTRSGKDKLSDLAEEKDMIGPNSVSTHAFIPAVDYIQAAASTQARIGCVAKVSTILTYRWRRTRQHTCNLRI